MAFSVTSDVSDRLLSGSAQSVPDVKLPEVARLLTALRSSAPTDGEREQEAVAAFVAAVAVAPTRIDVARRGARRRVVVVAAAAAVSLVLGGTAAAAASGSLPDGVQSAVSRVLSHVDVHVPEPDSPDAAAHGSPSEAGRRTPVGPDAAGTAQHGLCTAWAAHDDAHDTAPGHAGDATAFTKLRRAAHDRGMSVADFCAPVLEGHPPATGPSVPPLPTAGSTQDHGRSDAPHGTSGSGNTTSGDGHGQSGDEHGVGSGSGANSGANGNGGDHAADAASRGSANGNGAGSPIP